MNNIFTLKTIPLTADIGMSLKNFRIENKITAKSITEQFSKASSYISKLENGTIKKIDSNFLIDLCNFISKDDDGLKKWLEKVYSNFTTLSHDSKIIIRNIDDLLVEHNASAFAIEISNYMQKNQISVPDLAEQVNRNSDICNLPEYDSLPTNIWIARSPQSYNLLIKLSVPQDYLYNLVNNKIDRIHKVIAEAILYAAYTLGQEENPHKTALETLNKLNITITKSTPESLSETFNDFMKNMDSDAAEALLTVISELTFITSLTKSYGSQKIQNISNNMSSDLPFFFAYMALNLSELESKDKEIKQEFLNDIRDLIKKYSKETESDFNLYE